MDGQDSASRKGSLLEDLPSSLPEELFQGLAESGQVRIERILSRGHSSPEGFWYDQQRHEFVLLVRGRARLTLEGRGSVELGPGDYLNIPAHRRHRVEWTDPDQITVWLAVHY